MSIERLPLCAGAVLLSSLGVGCGGASAQPGADASLPDSTTRSSVDGAVPDGQSPGDAGALDATVESSVEASSDASLDTSIAPGLTKVGTGEYETFYLMDGVIYAYGGSTGTLGLGSYMGLSIPPRAIDTPAGLKFLDVQGGLHQSMAIDENHRVWTWGVPALSGSGAGNVDPTVPYMITVDSDGKVFGGVTAIQPTTTFDSALKSDGTVWVWGDCSGGILGDGNANADAGAAVSAPTQVPLPLPAGVVVTKILGNYAMLALATDGSVWSWGSAEGGVLGTGNTTDGTVPRKVVNLPTDIVDIAVGGSDWFIALTSAGELYGWGYRNPYLGIPGYAPQATPISLTTILSLPHPVKVVVADSLTTHVILTDGTLWGWGDSANGQIGDGQEPDWAEAGCGWDFMAYDLMVYKPVPIVPAVSNFTRIFANVAYDFYDYAQTADGKLYSWGRNKTGTLGNGVYAAAANGNSGTASDVAAHHANSWDVSTATLVTPFTTPPQGVLSPCCPAAEPDASGCM
jgi:alpha-tubulin suppressor-like RCC1 family protein